MRNPQNVYSSCKMCVGISDIIIVSVLENHAMLLTVEVQVLSGDVCTWLQTMKLGL